MVRRALLTAFAALALVANANGATVTLTLTKDTGGPGTWQLRARSSAGDNGGIASFNIPLLEIAILTNEAPFYQLNTTNFQPSGFSELRVPATDNNAVDKTVFASQKLIPTPTPNLEYGFGQTAGDWSASEYVGAAPSKRPAWQADLLLASGNYATGANPRVDIAATNLSVLVFDNTTGPEVVAANVVLPVIIVGDFNSDGEVDGDDYIVWRRTFGSTSVLHADGNGNGIVDAADYVVWRKHVGTGAGGHAVVSTSVPEPPFFISIMIVATMLCSLGRCAA